MCLSSLFFSVLNKYVCFVVDFHTRQSFTNLNKFVAFLLISFASLVREVLAVVVFFSTLEYPKNTLSNVFLNSSFFSLFSYA